MAGCTPTISLPFSGCIGTGERWMTSIQENKIVGGFRLGDWGAEISESDSNILPQGSGRSPDYVQYRDIEFRGYITVDDVGSLHQIGNILLEDHISPHREPSTGYVKGVARITGKSEYEANSLCQIYRVGHRMATCGGTGHTIFSEKLGNAGKYSPWQASENARTAASRGANKILRMHEMHTKSKHRADHICCRVLTFPAELSYQFAAMGLEAGRLEARRVFKYWYALQCKHRLYNKNQRLGFKRRLHPTHSHKKGRELPTPWLPHFHFHVTEPNVIIEKTEDGFLAHRFNPKMNEVEEKKLWKQAIEATTNYRFEKDQLPNVYLQFIPFWDQPRLLGWEKYCNRSMRQDLNNYYAEFGDYSESHLWRQSFAQEVLDYDNRTINSGYMTRLENYLPVQKSEHVCHLDGHELESTPLIVPDEWAIQGLIDDGMPVVVRDPGTTRYMLFMSQGRKCVLEHEDLEAIQPA